MRDCLLPQILETISLGILVLEPDGKVAYWNRWLENASGLPADRVVGRCAFELFSELDKPAFRRALKSVLSFGNFSFFSQKVHGHLISLPSTASRLLLMEQHCVMGPVREEGRVVGAYLVIEDVTEQVATERRLMELAMKDVLTSAYNRRFFDRRLAEELERFKRHGQGLSLVMIDIDFFKKVNDKYGHQFGDEALRRMAATCAATIRVSDLVARYGGEEFCVLLPDTDLDEGFALAQRLGRAVAEYEIRYQELSAHITISAGVASSREGDGPDDILRRADEALYKAKANGRNRVERSEP
jgi:PAS domain S-box/diguanylate cyclase (GGDEF) domain